MLCDGVDGRDDDRSLSARSFSRLVRSSCSNCRERSEASKSFEFGGAVPGAPGRPSIPKEMQIE